MAMNRLRCILTFSQNIVCHGWMGYFRAFATTHQENKSMTPSGFSVQGMFAQIPLRKKDIRQSDARKSQQVLRSAYKGVREPNRPRNPKDLGAGTVVQMNNGKQAWVLLFQNELSKARINSRYCWSIAR
jgi:hypothetical protein